MATALLKVLMAAALLGAIGAGGALGLGAAGTELMPTWLAALVILCGVVSVIGFAVLTISAQQRLPGKDRKKLFVAGCPPWMRWLTTSLSLVGLALWFWFGVHRYEPPPGGVASFLAGAFGLFIFPAIFGSVFSYSKMRALLNRRCPAGHSVPMGAAFCPVCGATLEPVA